MNEKERDGERERVSELFNDIIIKKTFKRFETCNKQYIAKNRKKSNAQALFSSLCAFAVARQHFERKHTHTHK